jgi:type II secretory pathway component GspD/PulD (secretin)
MKRLLFVITVILVVLATAAYCPGKDTQDKKNPFRPLEKAANPTPVEVNDSTPTGSELKETRTTEVFNLNFANAKQMEKTVSNLVSSGGKVGIDERLNSIVVIDTTANLEQIRQAVGKLDVKAPQVMIEALIVNVKLTNELKMGIDWTMLGTSTNYFNQGLSITGNSNPYGKVTFSTTSGNWNFQGLIDFVETNQNVKILANPKVLVLNNQTATINSIEEIPYRELTETSAGGSIGTVSFKEAGIKLEVTPQISNDGYIIMHVKPEQSAQTGKFTIDNSDTPVIETRRTDTTLRVRDGQTIIIGGLRKSEPSVVESKVPILGDIPLIGVLFRKVDTDIIESELGVFITPHIYTDGELSAEELKLIEKGEEKKSLYDAGDLLRLQPKDCNNR